MKDQVNIRVAWDKEMRIISASNESTLESIIKDLNLSPDSFIVIIGGKPVPLTVHPMDGDLVHLIRVASGG